MPRGALPAAAVSLAALAAWLWLPRGDAPATSAGAGRAPSLPVLPVPTSHLPAPPETQPHPAPAVSSFSPPQEKRDAAGALAGWRALPDDAAKAALAGALAQELVAGDLPAAIAALEAAADDVPGRWLSAALLSAWALRHPSTAADWASRQPPGRMRDRAIPIVALSWAGRDSPAAAHWIESLPSSAGRTAGLLHATREWAARDPIGAGAWLSTMPADSDRDRALSTHVEVLAIESPETAARWLSTLPPAEQPAQLIEEIARQWLAVHPAAARAWIAETALPPERRDALLASAGTEPAR